MPVVPLTSLYAGLLAGLYLALAFTVIRGRNQLGISLGSGGDERFERTIRAHGNFAEYVPFALLLMALAELNGAPSAAIHAIGTLLICGRVAHGWCFVFTTRNLKARVAGMVMTFSAVLLGAGFGVRAALGV